MYPLHVFSVWLHILAAVVWIGGMVFLALVLVPVIRRPEYRDRAASLVHATGLRFRSLGWGCLGLLLLSGAFNLAYRGFGWVEVWRGEMFRGSLGRTLGMKLALVAVILLLSAVHDFKVGPRATALWQSGSGSEEAGRLRRVASWIARLNLLLALIVVALGVLLVRGGL